MVRHAEVESQGLIRQRRDIIGFSWLGNRIMDNKHQNKRLIMLSFMIRALVVAGLTCLSVTANAQPANVVLVNGKVVTVDDRFSIAEALAIRGERIVAV